jgi:hypothetical protein
MSKTEQSNKPDSGMFSSLAGAGHGLAAAQIAIPTLTTRQNSGRTRQRVRPSFFSKGVRVRNREAGVFLLLTEEFSTVVLVEGFKGKR